MLNRVILVGRLVKDPVARQGNCSIATFTIALEDATQKTQDGKNGVIYLDVISFKTQADFTMKFCRKGNLVGVDGKIRQRVISTQDGNSVRRTEIVGESIQLLTPKSDTQQNDYYPKTSPKVTTDAKAVEAKNIVIDEDIDF